MKVHWVFIGLLVLLTGCGKQIPSEIIQPREMENLLYDYHIALGMSNHLKSPEKVAYKNYVFQKHQVTEALFDSSMVWYTREAQELSAIYDNLDKRFRREHSHTEKLIANRGDETNITTSYGDTVDIWREAGIYWMTEAPLMRRVSFEFKTDSNFHPKDAYLWNMDFHFFEDGEVVMGLNVVFENDSVMGEVKHVAQSGKQSIYLSTDSTYRMKSMNGFIYVPQDSVQDPHVLIRNISLTRYHRNEPDSLSMVATQK